jgi:hypothetical protein
MSTKFPVTVQLKHLSGLDEETDILLPEAPLVGDELYPQGLNGPRFIVEKRQFIGIHVTGFPEFRVVATQKLKSKYE